MNHILDPHFVVECNGIDPNVFKGAMAAMPAAVTVITTLARDGSPTGATLSAVTPLSLSPALMLACFDHHSDTLTAIRATRRFLIHVLADGQQELARCFARKGLGKFDGVDWTEGPLQLPLLKGSAITVACCLSEVVPGGDHTIVLGEIADINMNSKLRPLVYAQQQFIPLMLEGARG